MITNTKQGTMSNEQLTIKGIIPRGRAPHPPHQTYGSIRLSAASANHRTKGSRFGGVLNRTFGTHSFTHSLDHARASAVAISLRSSIKNCISRSASLLFSLLFCFLFILFYFTSCSGIIDNSQQLTLPENCGSFTLDLGGNAARTILPDSLTLSDFAVINLNFEPDSSVVGNTAVLLNVDKDNYGVTNAQLSALIWIPQKQNSRRKVSRKLSSSLPGKIRRRA